MASCVSCVASGSNYHHHHHHHIGQQGGGGDRNRIIGELTRGKDMADQLRQVLRETGTLKNPPALDLVSSAGHVPTIVAKILETFTQSISMLSGASHHVDVSTDEFSDDMVIPLANLVNSPPKPARKLEGSGDSCKKTTRKDKRGCHKRKRNTETWTKESPTWPEDRFAWRKYGQKVILNTKHPRNYFRCTHKYDEGCPATKQVQKIQDDPPVYRATYHALHSCTSGTRTSTSLLQGLEYPDPAHNHSSTIWSFQKPAALVIKASDSSSRPTLTKTHSSSPNTSINPHHLQYENCYVPAASASGSDSAGTNPSPALLDDDTCTTTTAAHQLPHLAAAYSSGLSVGSDHHGDVYSCTASSTQTPIEMEMTNSMISLDDFLDDI